MFRSAIVSRSILLLQNSLGEFVTTECLGKYFQVRESEEKIGVIITTERQVISRIFRGLLENSLRGHDSDFTCEGILLPVTALQLGNFETSIIQQLSR